MVVDALRIVRGPEALGAVDVLAFDLERQVVDRPHRQRQDDAVGMLLAERGAIGAHAVAGEVDVEPRARVPGQGEVDVVVIVIERDLAAGRGERAGPLGAKMGPLAGDGEARRFV